MRVVLIDMGRVLRSDRKSDPSADLQGVDNDSICSWNYSYGMSGCRTSGDLYVTASAILKMNRKLETMEKIAAELKDLSNKVGENIYENVMEGMEFQEEKKEQLGNVREELKERLEEPKAIVNGLRDGVKERLEEPKARMEKLAPKINVEEMKARMEELKAKYEEMAENRTKVGERLVKAFPKMQVRQHKEIFEELRERVRRSK